MEDKHTQDSILESKVFKIPIEEFEEELNLEGVKEKKKKIVEVFTSFNKLQSQEEYEEIKDNLHEACREGDVELIQIYLNSTISNETKTVEFKIDETNHTASLFKVNTCSDKFVIPRAIEHDSVEYLITSITGINKNIKTLKFEENSSVKTIYGFVFPLFSNIEEIYFPPSLKELKSGWCCDTDNLTKITISPSNGQFKFIDDQYLIGKSDSSNEEFDTLLFVRRDIEEISIPSNIKIISSGAFFGCDNLIKVLISTNSNLQTIESGAFYNTNIEEIYFPANLKELKSGWCYGTDYLTKITISPSNGQFKFIDDEYLIGKSDLGNEEFDTLLFASRNIKEISIPSNIKIISSYAFENCENLRKVSISTNSNLQTIESYAFSFSKIEEIFIPSKVSKICENSFENCENLTKVLIPPNSNLQTIESSAFCSTKIKEIYFPPSLKELKSGWCFGTSNLTKITISPSNGQFKFIDDNYLLGKSDSNNEEFDTLLFVRRDIKEISIPSNIKIISSYAFHNCSNLRKILISPNSNLQTIKSNAFKFSKIEEIFIPTKVLKICYGAFSSCENLRKVLISPNSNLQTIEKYAFCRTKIEEIYFPPSLKKLKSGWCCDTDNLTKITISPSNGQFKFIDDQYLIGKSDSSNEEFDTLLFVRRDIKEISIPSNIKIISSGAFSGCKNLIKVLISTNSNLQTIEQLVFSNTKIEEIFIPSKVSKICECAFYDCKNLQIAEISEESKLESFPLSAFSCCPEFILMIPSSLKKLIQ